MAIHITPEGLGQSAMIGAIALGVGLGIDTYQFITHGTSFLNTFNVVINLDERVRGLAQAAISAGLIMFGAGFWTVQIGAAAIIGVVALSAGSLWTYTGERGTAATQTAEIGTYTTTEKHQCPLTKKQSDWCMEDTDGDGIANQFDEDFTAGRTNCANRYYITSEVCAK